MASWADNISVTVVSASAPKTPDDPTYHFVFDEVRRLANRGLDIHLVRGKYEADSISYGIHFHGFRKKFDPSAILSIPRNLLGYPLRGVLGNPRAIYRESRYAANVLRVAREIDTSLIHAHFAYIEGLAGLLSKRRTGKPLVVTLHGYDILVDASTGYGVRLQDRINALVKAVIQGADAVIVASKAVLNEAKHLSDDWQKLHLIPNGVDSERFRPNLDGSQIRKRLRIDDCTVVLALSSHGPVKGLEYLVRAVPIVLRERKDAVFVLGGDGPLLSLHKQLATDLGVADRIIFTGRISRDEVPYYFAMSDIVVIPSVQEGFGLVASEGMASGKPVIASSVGGLTDQVVNGVSGFLVPPKEPDQIAKGVLWLIENWKESKRMGMDGRRLVEEKFSQNSRIERIIGLYKNLINGGYRRTVRK